MLAHIRHGFDEQISGVIEQISGGDQSY